MDALEIFDPTGATEVISLHAPRIDTLAGKTVAVMGPMANDSAVLMGGKSDYCPQHSVSLFEGMSAAGQQARAIDTFSFIALAVSIT